MSWNDEPSYQWSKLTSLKALELELTEGAEAALRILNALDNPVLVKTAIEILVRDGRQNEATDLIRDRELAEEWIDLATYLFAFGGEFERAQQLVLRADECPKLATMRRTRLAYAEGVIDRWRKQYRNESLLAARVWELPDKQRAEEIIETLEPLLSLVKANRRIDGDLELGAATYAVYCAKIVDNAPLLMEWSSRLIRHSPVPLIVAELCLRHLAVCPTGLATRLRLEHTDHFQAGFLAASVEFELLDRSDEAFKGLEALAVMANSDAEKEAVCIALFETCGGCRPEFLERALKIVVRLRPDESRLVGLLKIFQIVAAGDLRKAEEELEAIKDESDSVWWQARAHLSEKLGDDVSAQVAWEMASELLPHPEVLRRSVQASLDRRRYASAVRTLKKLLDKSCGGAKELKALAYALVQLGDNKQAAEYLAQLVRIDPTNSENRIALAQCHARSNCPHEGTLVLAPLCDVDDPALDVMLLQSELLASDGKPNEAFNLLKRVAEDNWDDPRFLLAYMQHGYAAAEDTLAHEAFARLIELRRRGHVPPDLMHEGTLEQLLEYGKEFRRRRETLQIEILKGRMPWLLAEHILGNPPTWAWALHTQALAWLSDEPLSHAAYVVYATNGFTVCVADGDRRLKAIQAPAKGTNVIVDITALLTLCRLGRLEQAAEYFGQLVLPARFGELRIRDADRFGLHNPSRGEELTKIQKEIDAGRIRVLEGASVFVCIDEYSTASGHVYRLQDFVAPLNDAQKVSSRTVDDLLTVAHKPSAVNDENKALQLGASVVIELSTLRTLSDRLIFEPVLNNFSVHLTENHRREVVAELRALDAARAAKEEHDKMWAVVERLDQQRRIKWIPILDSELKDDDPEGGGVAPIELDAFRLAMQENSPLFADDRVQQVMLFQHRADDSHCAFATGNFLVALVDTEAHDENALTDDMRQLMNWRYRFLVPTAQQLRVWTRQAAGAIPGNPLLDVAAYLHDCLRDPGLHCGLEASDPPMPMAARLALRWTEVITEFLASVWSDPEVSDETAVALTRWAGEEFIPSTPRGMWYNQIGVNLSRGQGDSAVSFALVAFAGIRNSKRANLGLRTLGDALGLADAEFINVVTEAIHAIK